MFAGGPALFVFGAYLVGKPLAQDYGPGVRSRGVSPRHSQRLIGNWRRPPGRCKRQDRERPYLLPRALCGLAGLPRAKVGEGTDST